MAEPVVTRETVRQAAAPAAGTVIMKARDGRLYQVAPDDVERASSQSGWVVAGDDEVAARVAEREQYAQFGGTGQQALAAVETAVRTGTFGLAPGLPGYEQRAEVLREESPIISGAAQAAGAIAPALVTGGIAGGIAGAAGLGARGVGVASTLAEGLVGGAAEEIEQARAEMRDVSAGNILLYGLGGEIVARGLPAALKMGAGRVRRAASAAEELAGEGVPSAIAGAEVRSVEAEAKLAREMPAGSPERAAALERTAARQYEDLATESATSAEQFAEGVAKMQGPNKLVAERMREALPEASPAQMDWITSQKIALGLLNQRAASVPELAAYAKRIDQVVTPALRRMDKAKTIGDEFLAARDIAMQLDGMATKLGADASLPPSLRDELAGIVGDRLAKLKAGLRDESLFGAAARIESDLAAGAERIARGSGDLRALGDPVKMRKWLQSSKADRLASAGRLDDALDGAEELLRAHEVHGTLAAKDIAEQRARIARIREARALADEVQLAVGRAEAAPAPAAPERGFWSEAGEFVAENIAEAIPFGGKLFRLAKRLRSMDQAARAASKQTARRLAGVTGPAAEAAGAAAESGIRAGDVVTAAAEELAPGPTKAYQRAKALIERRRKMAGSVDVGRRATPFPDGARSYAKMMTQAEPTGELWSSAADATAQRSFADGMASQFMAAEAFNPAVARLEKELARDQLNALQHYTTSDGYKEMQKALDGKTSTAARAALDDAVKKGIVAPGEVLRGVYLTDAELAALKASDTFTTPGFMSTSANRRYPRDFLANKPADVAKDKLPVLLTVHQRTGVPLPFQPREAEILLRPGTKFDVRIVRDEVKKGVFEERIHLFEKADDAAPSASRGAERGFADAGASGLRGILTSPMALTAGLGTAALAAYPVARSALERFSGDYSGPEEAFAAKRKLLDQELVSPEALYEAIGASLEDLPKLAPELYGQLAARVAQKVRFVRENLPPGIETTLMYPNGTPISTSALREFAVLWNTVFEPYSVLEDIEAGTATGRQMRILETSDNDIYEQFRADMVEEIGRNFRNVPLSTKLQMDILFNADGIAGPFFSSKAADMIAAANEHARKQGPRPRPDDVPLDKLGSVSGPGGLNAIQSSVTNRGGGS